MLNNYIQFSVFFLKNYLRTVWKASIAYLW